MAFLFGDGAAAAHLLAEASTPFPHLMPANACVFAVEKLAAVARNERTRVEETTLSG
jgi:hypothetical protein